MADNDLRLDVVTKDLLQRIHQAQAMETDKKCVEFASICDEILHMNKVVGGVTTAFCELAKDCGVPREGTAWSALERREAEEQEWVKEDGMKKQKKQEVERTLRLNHYVSVVVAWGDDFVSFYGFDSFKASKMGGLHSCAKRWRAGFQEFVRVANVLLFLRHREVVMKANPGRKHLVGQSAQFMLKDLRYIHEISDGPKTVYGQDFGLTTIDHWTKRMQRWIDADDGSLLVEERRLDAWQPTRHLDFLLETDKYGMIRQRDAAGSTAPPYCTPVHTGVMSPPPTDPASRRPRPETLSRLASGERGRERDGGETPPMTSLEHQMNRISVESGDGEVHATATSVSTPLTSVSGWTLIGSASPKASTMDQSEGHTRDMGPDISCADLFVSQESTPRNASSVDIVSAVTGVEVVAGHRTSNAGTALLHAGETVGDQNTHEDSGCEGARAGEISVIRIAEESRNHRTHASGTSAASDALHGRLRLAGNASVPSSEHEPVQPTQQNGVEGEGDQPTWAPRGRSSLSRGIRHDTHPPTLADIYDSTPLRIPLREAVDPCLFTQHGARSGDGAVSEHVDVPTAAETDVGDEVFSELASSVASSLSDEVMTPFSDGVATLFSAESLSSHSTFSVISDDMASSSGSVTPMSDYASEHESVNDVPDGGLSTSIRHSSERVAEPPGSFGPFGQTLPIDDAGHGDGRYNTPTVQSSPQAITAWQSLPATISQARPENGRRPCDLDCPPVRRTLQWAEGRAAEPGASRLCITRWRWLQDARPATLASPWDPGMCGTPITSPSRADVVVCSVQSFLRVAKEGEDFIRPILIEESLSDRGIHTVESITGGLHDCCDSMTVEVQAVEGRERRRMAMPEFLHTIRSAAESITSLNLDNAFRAQQPALAFLSRFQVLDTAARRSAARTHFSRGLLETAGALSGPHVAFGGKWVRNLVGDRLFLFVPPVAMTHHWAAFGREGVDWPPCGEQRLLLMKEGDVLFIPHSHPHAFVALDTCVSTQGFVWDARNAAEYLSSACWAMKNPQSADLPPLQGFARVFDEVPVVLERILGREDAPHLLRLAKQAMKAFTAHRSATDVPCDPPPCAPFDNTISGGRGRQLEDDATTSTPDKRRRLR